MMAELKRITTDFENSGKLGVASTRRLLRVLTELAQRVEELEREHERSLEGYPGH